MNLEWGQHEEWKETCWLTIQYSNSPISTQTSYLQHHLFFQRGNEGNHKSLNSAFAPSRGWNSKDADLAPREREDCDQRESDSLSNEIELPISTVSCNVLHSSSLARV